MRIAFALLGAPLLALLDQSTAFAVVSWSCSHGSTLLMHFVHFLFLGASGAAAIFAFAEWRGTTHAADALIQHHFLAGIATASAILSTLAIAAMWIPVWMISSCIA
jgi:hypothetical protein